MAKNSSLRSIQFQAQPISSEVEITISGGLLCDQSVGGLAVKDSMLLLLCLGCWYGMSLITGNLYMSPKKKAWNFPTVVVKSRVTFPCSSFLPLSP